MSSSIASSGTAEVTESEAMDAMIETFQCIIELEQEYNRLIGEEKRSCIDIIMHDLTTKFSIVCDLLARAIPIKGGDRYRVAERALRKARKKIPESATVSRLRAPTTPRLSLRKLQSCSSLPTTTEKVSLERPVIHPLISPRIRNYTIP